ncbi:RagB/SusD family nutrient uptake outer membrane protein [Chryseobacterium bernardetii]|uniref:RagB/SusD family nutrient uptake outer membrane protein n=1 Tax=Chryseobacterium bernardetii TaxID=1241978 RepID=A0A3G6U426_9FLAO|nr:RagB/SusD family nutrient uptake outer membrane protein [Chryseobacterium bernardetii]AZB25720.1 RagB/SusD family nutrient uptake outer membrane protein [Chryseobacterium bernardetii]AZB36102.1 RagB/SusD family nutrient uptake outer membrane protein [Chryseobacterium bernardetii]
MKLNKIKIKNIVLPLSAVFLLTATSCVKDLEREPITDVTSASVYKDFSNYKNILAKLYGGYAMGGQVGGDGDQPNSDINGINGGFSQYTRLLYNLNVVTTDEAVIGWNDGNLHTLHKMTWDSSNEFIAAMYYRIYTEIAFCNEFLRNVTDEKLASNGITGDNLNEAKLMKAEARFLRAQSYFYAIDMFGNVPFVDESYMPGSKNPPQRIERKALFNFIESELLAVAGELKDPRTNEYGRADKAAAWSLLAKLYLNAEVYTGTQRNTDCITYCNKVIAAGYSLKPKYEELFLADNNINNPEQILSVNFDGLRTQTNGGTTFLVHAAVGGTMPSSDFGINVGWGGIRTTKSFVGLFPTNGSDKRGRFYTSGQNLEINDLGSFSDGYAFIKYKNIKSNGSPGAHTNWVEADIPLYRLADIYLMYAEAVLRGGSGGNQATAIEYINKLRERAYGDSSGNVSSINLNFILDERSRELSWESTRRSDLIRFNKFTTGDYLWPWKGNVKDGKAVESYRNLFPIPAKDIIANPNLKQNPGY